MIPRRLLAPAVLAVFAGLLAWRAGIGARDLATYAPDQYVARADAFIRDGRLVADCSATEPRLVPRLDGASENERGWYLDSYLAADVRRFNRDPDGFGWAFVIDDDCRLRAVNPVVHAIELPFRRWLRWRGRVLWSGEGSDAILRSAARVITLRKPAGPVPASRAAAAEVGARRSLLQEGVVLLHFPGGRGQPAARIFHVGDQVVLHNRVRAGRPESVRLLGHQLPVGRLARLVTGDWLHVESRDRHTAAEETFAFLGGETREAASVVRRQNDRYERRSDDAGLGRAVDPLSEASTPFLDQLARGVDSALGALPASEGARLAESFDLQLTLRRELQLALGEAFSARCRALAPGQQPFAAGLTVMDGKSGDLLALATFPSEDDLAALGADAVADLGDGEEARRRRLLRNQNLVLHPIGSAGKPFLFAAVADAHPGLLGLVLDEHQAARRHADLFHCRLDEGYQLLAGHYGAIDFRTALELSCNKYTVELATLALAADRGRDAGPLGVTRLDAGFGALVPADPEIDWPRAGHASGVRLGGRTLRAAPDLGGFIFRDRALVDDDPERGAVVRCSSLDRLDQAGMRAPLGRLTGAATYRGLAPQGLPADATEGQLALGYGTNRYDLSLWRVLLDHLAEGADEAAQWRIRAALQEVAPPRVNLALNQVTRVRSDYISLLLGGATSVWTNVQLAEATARLVTGRAVEARLAGAIVARDDGSLDPVDPELASETVPLAPPIAARPEARAAVLEGMARVITGARGTATALRDELAAFERAFPGDTVAIYAKTGSPVTERAVPAAAARALEALVARGRLALEGRALVLRAGGAPTRHAARGDAGRAPFLAALERGLREIGAPRSPAVRRVLARAIDRAARDLADPSLVLEAIEGPIRADAGGLRLDRDDPLFSSRRETGMAGVLILALVRLPGRQPLPPTPEAFEDPGARVLVVTLHLEADEDSKIAVAAVEPILPSLFPLLR